MMMAVFRRAQVTDTFIFNEDSYSGVKERAERRAATKASGAIKDKSAFITSYHADLRLPGDFKREASQHGRGGQDKSIFSDYMNESIRKNVNLKASGHV
jgi:hypothetical protein